MNEYDLKDFDCLPEVKDEELKRDFQTTRSGGHSHVARLDNQGNGETTVVDRHKHLVRDFQIQQTEGHRHRVVR